MRYRARGVVGGVVMSGILFSGVAGAVDTQCQFTVTGDISKTAHYEQNPSDPMSRGRVSAATDYWMSDNQLKMALNSMHQAFEGVGKMLEKEGAKGISRSRIEAKTRESLAAPTSASASQKTSEAMKKDPRLILLMINCMGPEGGFSLSPSRDSKYANVPFKPGKYAIVDHMSAKPGDFGVGVLSIQDGGKRVGFKQEGTGSLEIKQFDTHGIKGEFSFKAKERFGKPERSVSFKGSFEYKCTGGDLCKS